ncbi:MAG TPA: alpha/beta hydrolase [Gemmataceae bacterium]|nr:alpha/beta hydrolase [Gemmataceae bacterium]
MWIGLIVLVGLPVALVVLGLLFILHIYVRYIENLARIFEEKPLFIIPRGEPVPGGEEVRFPTGDGLTLHGCYLRTTARRRGVILFGLEFGSNCWSCQPYCEHLVANGFDVFAFEPRSQGGSDGQPGYEPLQWVTNYEVRDTQAALAYLKGRGDADPCGIGFFGISKGGGAGLLAAARDPYVRCFVTDGIFGTHTTMVPYMRKWISLYSDRYHLQVLAPDWLYGIVAQAALARIGRARGCRFPHLERALAKLAPRPLLMIHGGADTYIKPEMARALFDRVGQSKEFWLVEGAKHNQALNIAGDEYRRRVLEFFQKHLPEQAQPSPVHALAFSLHSP